MGIGSGIANFTSSALLIGAGALAIHSGVAALTPALLPALNDLLLVGAVTAGLELGASSYQAVTGIDIYGNSLNLRERGEQFAYAGLGWGMLGMGLWENSSLISTNNLSSEIANTFREGRYRTLTLKSDVEAYRYWGGESKPITSWFTTRQTVGKIYSPQQAINALKLSEGNFANKLGRFVIPKGTTIYIGRVEGGARWATQVYIEDLSGIWREE